MTARSEIRPLIRQWSTIRVSAVISLQYRDVKVIDNIPDLQHHPTNQGPQMGNSAAMPDPAICRRARTSYGYELRMSESSVAVPETGPLTTRELAVLSLLRQGKANKIIAYELGISENTAKVHIRNILRKVGATNRTQAIYKSSQLLRDEAV